MFGSLGVGVAGREVSLEPLNLCALRASSLQVLEVPDAAGKPNNLGPQHCDLGPVRGVTPWRDAVA